MTDETLTLVARIRKVGGKQAIEKWRSDNPSGKIDLRWADLREADLSGANLRGANLRETDLRGANLRETDLRGANLRETDLSWANLHEADLSGADLHEADLREADLSKVHLSGVIGLASAMFEGAKVSRKAQAIILAAIAEGFVNAD